MPKACPYVMRCQRHIRTLCGARGMSLRYDVICTRHMLTTFGVPWTVGMWGLGLDPEGLDFAADSDDVAGGDGAHDEHCHQDRRYHGAAFGA